MLRSTYSLTHDVGEEDTTAASSLSTLTRSVVFKINGRGCALNVELLVHNHLELSACDYSSAACCIVTAVEAQRSHTTACMYRI